MYATLQNLFYDRTIENTDLQYEKTCVVHQALKLELFQE